MSLPANPYLSDLSPLRIGAFSTALGLHLIAFGLLLLPTRALDAPARAATPEAIMAVLIANVVSRPALVPPVPKPPVRPTPTPRATPVAATVPVQLAESALVVEAAATATEVESIETSAGPAGPSQAAQIAYDEASPPPYPSLAKRRGWEGTVLLRVRVDTNGRPREVLIERSSGHVLLDRSASEHVLARWLFQPALRDGQPVGAWARVPINFTLQRG